MSECKRAKENENFSFSCVGAWPDAFPFVSSKVTSVPPCVSIFVACVREELITDIILLLI